MVSTFYKGSDGCILAFDVTDLESFEALDTWRGDVLAKIIPVEQSYPMVVLGNKIDLADRQVPFIHSLIHSFANHYVSISYARHCVRPPTFRAAPCTVLTLKISQSSNGYGHFKR